MPAYQAWCEIFTEHGCELPLEKWVDRIGRESGYLDVLDLLEASIGRPVDRAALQAKRDEIKTRAIGSLDLMPGVRELTADAKRRGMKVGVASSSTQDWVCGHLDRLAFREHWDAIACRAPDMRGKPAPDIYLAAVAALGVAPREALAFEDSLNGVTAAKAAGLWCVAVPNALTRAMDLTAADLQLASLADARLGELLESFGSA